MRILVVEDDENLNRQLADALKESGYVSTRPLMARRGIISVKRNPI